MSATIDQRSKEQVTNGSSKDAQFDYIQSQMSTYATDGAPVPGAYLNPYYTPYMPYQPAQADMSAAAWGTGDSVRLSYMSGYGGQVAPTDYGQVSQGDYGIQQGGEYGPQGVMDYGSQGIDYASMLDYNGYAAAPQGAYGWFPNGGDSSAWGNVGLNDMGVALTKDDLQGGTGGGGMDRGGGGGRGYPNSYYSVETMQMYGGANGFGGRAQQRDENEINSIEQGMNKMNLGANRQSGGGFELDRADGEGNINGGGSSLAETISAGGTTKGTWANVAGQPVEASSRGNVLSDIHPRAPVPSGGNGGGGGKHGGGGAEYGNWGGEGRNDYSGNRGGNGASGAHNGWSAMRKRPSSNIVPGTITVMQRPSTAAAAAAAANAGNSRPGGLPAPPTKMNPPPVALPALPVAVDKPGTYNPHELDDASARTARFFIIKSYSEDDIHRSIKYAIWCSTEYGNKRLDAAWQERDGKGPVYLLYSVNGSGHFCGIAEMTTGVDYRAQAGIWAQSKWKGQFGVRWLYVKDVPNSQLRHIRLENNEGKPVTNSRDTQEVPPEKGRQVLRIVHQYRHTTSIFDDFSHYEKRQEEDCFKKDQNGGRD